MDGETRPKKAQEAGKLFPFFEKRRWGYMDGRGKTIIRPRYESASDFNEGLAEVRVGKKWSFINGQGKIVFSLPKTWDPIGYFSEGLALFCVKQKYGFFNRRGQVVVPPKYDDVQPFSNGRAAVNVGATVVHTVAGQDQEGGKWGYIDTTGRLVIPIRFDVAFDFSDGVANVWEGKKGGFIDKKGALVLKQEKRPWDATRFSEGLAVASISQREGFIDKKGQWAIPARFKEAGNFSEGLAAVRPGKKWGFINRKGKFVIAPRFKEVKPFSEGLARVRNAKTWMFINRKGKAVVRPKKACSAPQVFNAAEDFSGELSRVHVGGKLTEVYDAPWYWKGGAWYYVNRKGDIIRRCRRDKDSGDYGQAVP
jgi:hypothetical protein